MNKRNKLALAGLATLALAVYVGIQLKGTEVEAGPVLRPEQVAQRNQQNKLMEKLEGIEVPEEMKATEIYLEKRFGDIGAVEAGRTVSEDGEEMYVIPEIRVGVTGKGQKIYAQLWAAEKVYQGPVLKAEDREKAKVSAVFSGRGTTHTPGDFLQKHLPNMKNIPIDQAPHGLYGNQ